VKKIVNKMNYYLRRIRAKRQPLEKTYSFLSGINFAQIKKFSPQKNSSKSWRLNWILPPITPGSGGFMTLFRMVSHLEKKGHQNGIYIYDPFGVNGLTLEETRQIVATEFLSPQAEVFFGIDKMACSDALFATLWYTAYAVAKINNARMKYYFVQDYEPFFYPQGCEYKFAQNTYRLGLKCITAGPWLAGFLNKRFNLEADYFDLSYDHKIYCPDDKIKRSAKRIAFYARSDTPRRGVELGILALSLLKKRFKDLEIIFYGQKNFTLKTNLPFEFAGILNHQQLAKLYNQSTLGLVLSLTNHSLVPREMMACKLPVVDIKGDNNTAIFGDDGQEISLAKPDPYSLYNKMKRLLLDQGLREKMAEKGYQAAKKTSWEKSAKKFAAILKSDLMNYDEN
jgi:glycosyltransferase involved in cell wall biosynthesis